MALNDKPTEFQLLQLLLYKQNFHLECRLRSNKLIFTNDYQCTVILQIFTSNIKFNQKKFLQNLQIKR